MAEAGGNAPPSLGRSTLKRGRPTFLTRTATDDAGELLRRSSLPPTIGREDIRQALRSYDGAATKLLSQQATSYGAVNEESNSAPNGVSENRGKNSSSRSPLKTEVVNDKPNGSKKTSRLPQTIRPVGGTDKLDMFSGVFVPTSLNVLSILMFIRFGLILGQTGVLGMIGLLIAAYIINLFTTFSISAVASNGTVRGGGAYYLISRSLGPEFGGSIGIVSYLGFVFNTGMNAVGLIDCLVYNFGSESGIWSNWLREGWAWMYLWSSLVVVFCVIVCLAGSAIFARASNGLLLILLVATFSIPFSSLVRSPFRQSTGGKQYTEFTGLNTTTLRENLLPHFTKGAAGSQVKGHETWSDMFGILFPATGGIFAGASMSGDLKNPSKAIPVGTLYGILLTFVSYALVILAMGSSITRATLYTNVNVIQDVNLSGILVLLGEIATTSFSVLMGIIGSAKQLQAIARDGILPGLSIFGQGTERADDPIYAILFTWFVAQLTILFDINSIASFVTMSYLMMNFALHLACLLLKLSSAPNFRPSFRFFNQWTALLGALLSVASMFFVDGISASGSIAFLLLLFLLIHYTTPPKPWGSDVTAGLVYHQIRKYLLRLKTESVKYWRPQILLFVNDPRRGYKLINFANSLKKGGLFILGHVIVTDNFGASVPEARKQQAAWAKFIDFVKIKCFINVAISPSIEWGTRNIFLSAGLGGMRPNIVMLGFYNLQQYRQEQPLIDIPSPPPERKSDTIRKRRKSIGQVKGALPTDTCYVEKRTDLQSYVLSLEDLILKLQTNVAVAVGFNDLEVPGNNEELTKKYIDLWPIQMSAMFRSDEDGEGQSVTTTNFDTYTLILQLGCILNTVPAWKKAYKLRVAVFVEYESDMAEETERVTSLLESLRISAEVLVFWLASGHVKSYQLIVNGIEVDTETEDQVNQILDDELWWKDLQQFRGKVLSGEMSGVDIMSMTDDTQWPSASYASPRDTSMARLEGLRKLLHRPRHRSSFGNISSMGLVPRLQTHRLDDDLISRHASRASSGSEYEESEDDEYDTDDESDEGIYLDDPNLEVFGASKSSATNDEDATEPTELGKNASKVTSKATSKASSKKSSKKGSGKGSKKSSRASSLQPFSTDTFHLEGQNGVSQNERVRFTGPFGTEDTRGRRRSRDDAGSNVSDERLAVYGDSPPRFTANPVPISQVASQEDAGPSIMFADQTHPKHKTHPAREDSKTNLPSIYTRTADSTSPAKQAEGFPSAASVPLSFNDLPCRAQHLILNELISQHCEDTAVIFTTLPAPMEGTYKSESDSLSYLTDLEVLTQGLGPVLLVHSNSMTVTTNL